MDKKIDWNLVKVIEEVADDYQGDILIKVPDVQDKVNQSRSDCPLDDDIAWFANYLQDNGYGNINQALEEFADDLIESFNNYENETIDIEELIKIRLKAHCE